MATQPKPVDVGADYKEKYGFFVPEDYVFKAKRGLNPDVVKEISFMKGEPEWMTKFRLKSLEIFRKKPMPTWGADLSVIDFENIFYYLRPADRQSKSWDELPPDIKATYDRLGVPEAERKFLAGVSAQYESEVVYHSLQDELSKKGVIFLDTDSALREHPELFKEYFGTVIPPADNKFSALNSAVWSGGSFIYVPKGVKVDIPLQAYFRINAENMGQFERTLIICDEGSFVHYIEGCTAPIYTSDSLHSAVVEIIVKKDARCRYTTIQNWSTNVFNLVTKRAMAYQDATMEWVDGNLGCLAAGTRVFTNNDVKAIESIKPGDHVYSLTPEFNWVRQEVTATKVNPPRPTYRLTTADHREVIATDNHPFLVLRKQGRLRQVAWLPLSAIRVEDEIAISGVIPDHGRPYEIPVTGLIGRSDITVPRATDPELMWLMGFYLGDGTRERGRVIFCVPESDKSYERVRELVRKIFGLEGRHHLNAQLRYSSTDFSLFIERMGFSGTARTKRLPEWAYTLPVEQKRALIDGYIAADGHIRANHKNLSITSASRELLEDIKALALSAGLNPLKVATWTRKDLKPLGVEEKEYTHHFLYFGDRNPDAPVYFSPVMSIEDAGVRETFDIEVDGQHNFIANGIVAHNSQITMKYPSVYLMEPGAKGDVLSIAFAGKGQHQDAGGKMIHVAPNTTSTITSKSISKAGGRTSYRGHIKVYPGANNSKSFVKCDALLLDDESRSDTYPYNDVDADNVTLGHEATVSKVSDEQLFYLMSRGIPRAEAETMIVNGFIEPFTKELPLEYAVELNRLIQLEMEGSVG
jgi:Fe-S cluster assembly scaffold protein SufB/intein/homing endonuclease